ncbi:MAG: hypothetical protein ACFFCE_12440 [Promethearchaeota archaeon]
MSGKQKFDFSNYIKDAQKLAKEYVVEKDKLNNSLKKYILNLQNIDSEIYNLLFEAREFYYEKRSTYNMKLAKLKNKRIEYERSWNNMAKKIKHLQKPKLNTNISVTIDYTKRSIEEIKNKIDIMKNKLEEQILDIEEENETIDKLRALESSRKEKINLLTKLEQKKVTKLRTSEYYITQKRIETLENNLKEIYEQMIELFNKRFKTHKKMLELYRNTRGFENIKKEIVNELKENKIIAEDYYFLFLKLMNQNKKIILDKFSNRPKSIIKTRKIISTPRVKAIITMKKKYKKLEKEKLAIALDKKESGKKLDFYELQLILKHSKNKRL